jgi:hypothetical protein
MRRYYIMTMFSGDSSAKAVAESVKIGWAILGHTIQNMQLMKVLCAEKDACRQSTIRAFTSGSLPTLSVWDGPYTPVLRAGTCWQCGISCLE